MALAQRRLEQGNIDAVTLDVTLNGESGLELLKWIRKFHPRVMTVLVTAGEKTGARTEVDALLLGAAALIIKPSGPNAAELLKGQLLRALEGAGRKEVSRVVSLAPCPPAAPRELIAIGASTGGPPVVQAFLSGLPASFDVPVVIVQHMPTAHVPYFAELLVTRTGRPGKVAEDGERVLPGHFYLAGFGKHLVVRRRHGELYLHHDHGPEEHFCRPAVDPFFRSVAAVCGATAAGVVMTGMGSDGGAGALALHAAGAPVVVQDEASSVVWSMPRAVVDRGAACAVVARTELSRIILSWTKQDAPGGRQ